MLVRRITLSLIASLTLLPCATAWGDADPASDFLPGFDSYLPYGNQVAKPTQGQLDKLLKIARARNQPFKVAVIASPPDLGAVTALYNKPQQYARFLYREIKPIITGGDVTLLVVMPDGVGVIGRDAETKGGKLATAVRPPKGATPTALAETAVTTIERVAAADGRALPKVAPTAPATAAPGASHSHRRFLGLLAAAVLAAVGVAVLLRARLLQRT